MRFFFYGTLIAGSGNAVERAVHARLRDLGPATTAGLLHAIPDGDGWYPALVPGEGRVAGRLYAALPGFGADDLAALDGWEDFDPARPGDSLYRRESVMARAAAGFVEAEAYRFAQPLPAGAVPVPDGDFAAWLRQTGRRAYG